MMQTKRQRVEVHWHDIVSDSSWIDSDKVEAVTPVDVISIGYIINDTNEHVVLAHSMIEKPGQKSSDYTVIPWGCVQSIWLLRRNGVYAE